MMPSLLNRISPGFRRDSLAIIKILSPFLFVVVVAIIVHDFVMRAVVANVTINAAIFVTALYCVCLILARLRSAQGDFRVIERFGREALAGRSMKELLEEPWLKQKYVRHYLAHIAQTGGLITSQLDQSAIENELRALGEEYESRLELPQFLVGFMIAMGLIGTFVGLLEALTGISVMLDGLGAGGDGGVTSQFTKLISELHRPLAGMGMAFSASMFGLITSLMLAMMMTNLRRYINRVMALARNVMHDLIELSRPAARQGRYDTPLSVSGEDGVGGGSGGGGGGGANSGLLASRIDLLIKKIEFLMQAFGTSIEGTQKLNELLGFGPRMKEISEKTLEEIKGLNLATAEQQQLSNRLIEVNVDMSRALVMIADGQRQTKDVGEKSLESIKAMTVAQSDHGRLAQKLIDVGIDTGRLLNNLIDGQRQTKEVGERNVEILKSTTTIQTDHGRLIQKLIDICGETGRLANEMVDGQRLAHGVSERGAEGLLSVLSAQGEQSRLLQKVIDVHGDAVRLIESALDMQRRQSATHEAELEEIKRLTAFTEEQRQVGQALIEGVGHSVRLADNSLGAQKLFATELIAAIRNLEERLGKTEEVEVGAARHLWAIKESLTKLGQNMGVVELVSTGVSHQTLLLESLVSEARMSQASLFAIQQNLRGENK